MTSYKLYYFPLRSNAELARQILAVAEQPFEDVRIPQSEWPEFKNKMPFGQMPVLEVDGKMIPQSGAIARYLAKQFNLTGADDIEAALADAIYDQFKDYLNDFRKFFWAFLDFGAGDKDALRKEYGEPARDKFFGLMNRMLIANLSGYLVGDGLTWADLLLSEHTATLEEFIPGFLNAFPMVLSHAAKIRKIPSLDKWLKTRPISTC